MASIQAGGTHSGRKALDSELPLVPFIDLLLCCVMFLLVTVVWNRLAAVDVSMPEGASPIAAPIAAPALRLSLASEGWLLVTADGARFSVSGSDELTSTLETLGPPDALQLSSDDGVPYRTVVAAIDAAIAAGVRDVSVTDGAR